MPKRRGRLTIDADKDSPSRASAWSDAAKEQAIARVGQGEAIGAVARSEGIPQETLFLWIRKQTVDALTSLGLDCNLINVHKLSTDEKRSIAAEAWFTAWGDNMKALKAAATSKDRKDLALAAAICYDKLALAIGLPTSRTETVKGAPSQVDLVSALRTLYNEASRSAAESVVIDITPSASAESTPKA